VFTNALLRYLTSSQLDVEQMFQKVREDVIRESHGQQVPWTASSLIGSFHFLRELDQSKEVVLQASQTNDAPLGASRSPMSAFESTEQFTKYDVAPRAGAAAVNQAVELARSGRFDTAASVLSNLISLEPHCAVALRLLGLILHMSGRDVEAIAALRRAVEIDEGDATAHLYLCLIQGPTSPLDAVVSCETSISSRSECPECHLGLASALLATGQTVKAYSEVSKAISSDPTLGSGYALRGRIEEWQGHSSLAQQDYERAVRMSIGKAEQ
jgi:Flp pilus assembly protein TadD